MVGNLSTLPHRIIKNNTWLNCFKSNFDSSEDASSHLSDASSHIKASNQLRNCFNSVL